MWECDIYASDIILSFDKTCKTILGIEPMKSLLSPIYLYPSILILLIKYTSILSSIYCWHLRLSFWCNINNSIYYKYQLEKIDIENNHQNNMQKSEINIKMN